MGYLREVFALRVEVRREGEKTRIEVRVGYGTVLFTIVALAAPYCWR